MKFADRLRQARHSTFVGRARELQLLESMIVGEDQSACVVFIHGPGGTGKSSLLNEVAFRCRGKGVSLTQVDARNVEPSPDAFADLFHWARAEAPGPSAARHVILLDSYERLLAIDGWIRTSFLPSVSDQCLFIIAGRAAPSSEWRTDAGWQALVRVVPLTNLDDRDVSEFLQKQGVERGSHRAFCEISRGHPLALTLLIELHRRDPRQLLSWRSEPDVIQPLLSSFIESIPSEQHRSAIEAASVVPVLTEGMLETMLGCDDVHELFLWLHRLSILESGPHGLSMHELARDVWQQDLVWRRPERERSLRLSAAQYLLARLGQVADSVEQRRLLHELLTINRHHPVAKPYFSWREAAASYSDGYRLSDRDALAEMVRHHEGAQALTSFERWLETPHHLTTVIRGGDGAPLGFYMALRIDALSDSVDDPVVAPIRHTVATTAALREGEQALFFRFWMTAAAYQNVSPGQGEIFVSMLKLFLNTPRLALTFIPVAQPRFWGPLLEYGAHREFPGLAYAAGSQTMSLYGIDWRHTPPSRWLQLMAERVASAPTPEIPPRLASASLAVLSRNEFEEAAREALRHFGNPLILRENALLRTRMLTGGGSARPSERVERLQQTLARVLADAEATSPRLGRAARAVRQTYLVPVENQHQAAYDLGMSFSTYRRHLKLGIETLIARLWRVELDS